MLFFSSLFWTIPYDRYVSSHANSYNNAFTQRHFDSSQKELGLPVLQPTPLG